MFHTAGAALLNNHSVKIAVAAGESRFFRAASPSLNKTILARREFEFH
jgi:hypothetical protein